MLSREEQKRHNLLFWNLFKDFMKPYKSSNGQRMHWVNYPSHVKDLYVRLETDARGARLCLDVQSKDEGVRSIIWEQLTELKAIMEERMHTQGNWISNYTHKDGRQICRICWEIAGVNYLKTEDWPVIFEFLKGTLLAFDLFYQEFKEILINLTD